jgi:hypothetical protein
MDKELFTMPAIGERIRTQNNRGTADPVFCIQVLERIGPIDPEHSDGSVYFYDQEMCELYYEDGHDPDEWKRLNVLYCNDYLGDPSLPDHIVVSGYKEKWITIQTCFTEVGCQAYLELNGHNLRHYFGHRIYVDHSGRNVEMNAIREYLRSLPSPDNS